MHRSSVVAALAFVILLACNATASTSPTPTSAPVPPASSPIVAATQPQQVPASPLSPATALPTLAPAVGPQIAGCPIFPPDNYWNTRIDSLPVDPRSAAYVRALGGDTEVHPDFGSGLWEGGPIGIPFVAVPGGTAAARISFDYADESDPGPYPIPANPPIEGGPDASGDRHILIVDQTACKLVEIYHAVPNADGSWQAGSGAVFDLRSNALRPDTWTSADAAGLPILPGLVRYDEVAAGDIRHAIRVTASAIRDSYVWPARHHAECGGHSADDLSVPPMGQRFRLKASFDMSSYSPEVQVILTALKQYGIVLADCGADWYITGAPDEHWNNDDLVGSLRSVHGSDFEAVDTSGLMLNPDSAQARQTP